MNFPIAIVDRNAISMILDEHLNRHMELDQFIQNQPPTPGRLLRNPYPIDLEALAYSMINYVGMVRRGDVPVDKEAPNPHICRCLKCGSSQ